MNKKQLKRVTVLIDTYNHENFIEDAIQSVLHQTVDFCDVEILVIDDGSVDKTHSVVEKFSDRLRIIRKENGGQASAFNLGIKEAQGDIIAFLDGDDWWAPNKLSRVLEILEANTDVGAVGHGIIESYQDGTFKRVVNPETLTIKLDSLDGANQFLKVRSQLGTSRFTARKTLLQSVLPIPEELVVEADEFMFTLAPCLSPVIVLNECLTYYRLHNNNLYQFLTYDETKVKRKMLVHQALAEHLPHRLQQLGCKQEVVEKIHLPSWIIAERGRLALQGGRPWETYRVERVASSFLESQGGKRWWLFRSLLGFTALILPPRIFYRLRRYYADKKIYQFWRRQENSSLGKVQNLES